MTAHDGTTLELRGDRDIVITRAFNAPRALVWRAITTAELVQQWWAPASRGLSLEEKPALGFVAEANGL